MIEKNLAENLGLKGAPDPLHFCWTRNVTRVEEHSCNMKLGISGTTIKRYFSLVSACTVKTMELPVQSIKLDDLINRKLSVPQRVPYRKYDEA